jgi:hypothetical protein
VGQHVTVRFLVQSTSLAGSREYLNALEQTSAQYGFSAVVAGSVVRTAEYDPANYDFGHTIAVSGTVQLLQSRPVIVVNAARQITSTTPSSQ